MGALGEVVAEGWMAARGIAFTNMTDRTDLDYELSDGRTIDVKTKDRTVAVEEDFACTVPLYNHDHQRPDYYFFVSLQREGGRTEGIDRFPTAFVLGAIDQRRHQRRAKMWKAGHTDPANGTTFWTDCLNVYIHQLVCLEVVARSWRQARDEIWTRADAAQCPPEQCQGCWKRIP